MTNLDLCKFGIFDSLMNFVKKRMSNTFYQFLFFSNSLKRSDARVIIRLVQIIHNLKKLDFSIFQRMLDKDKKSKMSL